MELTTRNLKRRFADFSFDADIHAAEGELVCLLGPSGCGKTTGLQLIAGILAPDQGSIYLGQREITALPPWKRNIGLVFQDYALFPHMTVYENIAYGLRQQGASKYSITSRVEELLDLVELPGYSQRRPEQLSGGEKQRVALARAVAPSPALLLLDEPLSALDARLRTQLRREIRNIQKRIGLTTIYVTHDQEEALSLSDRIIVMQNGTIQQSGTPQELYNSPLNEFVARFIGNSNLVPCNTQAGSDREVYFFRPEDTRIHACSTESSDTISFQLTLKSLEYVGPYYILEGVNQEYSVRAHANEGDLTRLHISDFSPEDPPQLWFCIERSKTKIISS
ncbi:MAG: ABC transporter ATP-binding protein [Spirochaetia bacterium]|nr:ABC transporter ATP-binding protein [Spirochaetia bacterium]